MCTFSSAYTFFISLLLGHLFTLNTTTVRITYKTQFCPSFLCLMANKNYTLYSFTIFYIEILVTRVIIVTMCYNELKFTTCEQKLLAFSTSD